jgi:sugar phosphate isomerase/epimerase
MSGLDYASLLSIPISYATCSLGNPSDPPPLLDRLDAISTAGFAAVELSFPDILSYGQILLGHEVDPKNYDKLCQVAKAIKEECDKRKLGIMMLQPFANFEGWPEGSDGRKDAFERARGWIRIMQACGTDMLQVGSTDSPLEKLVLEHTCASLERRMEHCQRRRPTEYWAVPGYFPDSWR